MTKPQTTKQATSMEDIFLAFDDLPVLDRLHYAANLVSKRAGDPGEKGYDPTMWLAGEVIWGVIKVLRTVPHIAKVRTPEA